MNMFNRREFIRASLFGGIAAATIPSIILQSCTGQAKVESVTGNINSRVSLVTGSDRADMAFRTLQPFSKEIARAVGKKRIILKPNFVSSSIQLSATHCETIEGILEFYKSINKLENCIIAESPADGPTIVAYDNYKFIPVAEKYKVPLVDLDETPIQLNYLLDERDLRPKPIRVSSFLMDRNNFVMSVARMKTHDRIIATLSLKNIVVGAPIKDIGFVSGRNRPEGTRNDKPIVHGNGIRGINYNLFTSAYHLRPDLAFIDGYDGMQGNGPTRGTAVDSRVCLAGLDWLAVDRIGVELMGINAAHVGYLNFCGDAGLGQYDINKIDVIGEKVANHIKPYEMPSTIERQLEWMNPVGETATPSATPQQPRTSR
ncbi:MAG: DUF362 domain-containing protein [Tannerella sp.]|nr:DUF362 domain-containing protein [Tannerella sp.]